MSATQSAIVNFSAIPGSVELREVPIPEIGVDDVLLEVEAVGVCGSDLHMWTGQQSWKVNYPCVLGHEFAGRIAKRGANVAAKWADGLRVVSETHAIVDPDSPLTRRGLYNLDPNRRGYGAAVDGAMTHFVRVPSRILHRVPDGLPLEIAALSEPCCVAFNATAMNSRIVPGDRILVLGPGPIGVLCAAIARLCGAEVALAGLERDRARLEKARAYGCEVIIGDPLPWCRSGDGLGAEGILDATGVSAALETALAAVRPAGWITKVGWGPQPLGISLDPLVQKNVRLQGSFSHHWEIWERVLALLASGKLDVRPIIGGEWSLPHWCEAFETMHRGDIIKAVLRPSA
ncbi:MAG TPA: zinc-binding dehydrogenase [Verrucomicrobiota bacterium]|nr:Zn-dependent alcohol dehydrogenase [Verrucomicrobiales bacterium]HRI11787.1 zinc-binding dehydrogenase [Verrucomicrobiota bacterium]